MTAILVPSPTVAEPEEDDAAPEDRLQAALRVHGGDLLEFAGQMTIEQRQDGTISGWLWRDIKRAVGRLNEAVAEFAREKPANV
jgi:hypothetical protein